MAAIFRTSWDSVFRAVGHAVAWGLAACRAGLRVRFFTAAGLISQLETEQKQYTLDRFLRQLDRAHLLICDELGYVTMSRGGVELLFRVFADRYELITLLPNASGLREGGAVAVGGPAVVLDVFSPVREDYAALANRYIPAR